jgi:methionyl-tRNA formyltransferase
MNIGVLSSGNLGMDILTKLIKNRNISFVMTDSNSNEIVNFCNTSNIPLFKGNPRNGAALDFLSDKRCDVLLSVNYLFLIDDELINFPFKYAINIHGSLLPKYRGRTPHVWAIINGETKTGISAHLIDASCDTGDIIEQIEIDIDYEDTGANILDKFKELYGPLIEKVLTDIERNQLRCFPQDHDKATFFGKRTPEDGKIDWNWKKEQIRNWVRAQAYPYPGAFTYMNNVKITIDKVSFCNEGFDSRIPNGTVLTLEPFKVKTANGIILIDSVREKLDNIFDSQIILK